MQMKSKSDHRAITGGCSGAIVDGHMTGICFTVKAAICSVASVSVLDFQFMLFESATDKVFS